MRVISNFDDVNPAISGFAPTIADVGRSGNAATYTGQVARSFYFASEPVSRNDDNIFSGWVKVTTGATGLVGLTLREAAGDNNGYQFFIDNRNGTGSSSTIQIRKDNTYSPPLGENGAIASVSNGNWYRIEIQYRQTAPNLCMRLYDETGIKMGEINVNDTSYNSSTLYLGGYGNSEYCIIDEITEQSAVSGFKGVYFANSSNGYKYRKKLTVNPTKMSGSNYKFVSLVSMTDENLKSVSNGGGVTNGTLLDVRFETPEGVKLPHQIEKYVASTGQIIAWVGHDIIFANTEIYMYYGSTIVAATTEDNWIPSVTTSGIKLGVLSSDITANRNSNSAAGGYNLGELFSYGNSVVDSDGTTLSISDSSGENSAQESGSFYYGYFMYHTTATAGRFTMASGGKRANFALVTFNGTSWQYDNNTALVNFTPNSSDVLVARIKCGSATGFECFQTIFAGEEDVQRLWYWPEYAGVYHMECTPDASASTFEHRDSGWYSQSGSSNGSMNSADLVAGKIHTGIDFDGSNDWINLLDSTGSILRVTGDLTLSIWVYPRTGGSRRNIVGKAYGGEYEITQEVNNTVRFYWGRSGANSGTSGASNGYQGLSGTIPLTLNSWNHIVVSRKVGSGGWLRKYINGVLDNEVTPLYTSAVASAINTTLGNGRITAGWFNGIMDELRFARVAREEDWIKAEYNNQNDPGTFYIVGEQEQYSPVKRYDGSSWIPVSVDKKT